jgi:hypothetical protein
LLHYPQLLQRIQKKLQKGKKKRRKKESQTINSSLMVNQELRLRAFHQHMVQPLETPKLSLEVVHLLNSRLNIQNQNVNLVTKQ